MFNKCSASVETIDTGYELSFPLPDLGWITPNLFIAAVGLLMDQWFGAFFSVIAGSGMVFLGLIDFASDVILGRFKIKDYRMFLAILIVLVMLIFGPIFIIYGWFNL